MISTPVTSYHKVDMVEISDRLEEAVRTLRRLPKQRLKGHFNSWPQVIRSSIEIQNAAKTPMRLPPPSSAAISRMDECFEWILWLDDETERRIVWLRAERVYWKQICARVGFSRTKAWEIHTMALLKIATRENIRRMRELEKSIG